MDQANLPEDVLLYALAPFWTPSDLARYGATSTEAHAFVKQPRFWRPIVENARKSRPRRVRRLEQEIAGVRRRRNHRGGLVPLTGAERATVWAVPVRELAMRWLDEETRAVRRSISSAPEGAPFRHPRGACRACAQWSVTSLVWGGVCATCFGGTDAEISATKCTAIGIGPQIRRTWTYRRAYGSFSYSHMYRASDVYRALRGMEWRPERRGVRNAYIGAARRGFAHLRRCLGGRESEIIPKSLV